ncbi:MAG: glycosyltransferase [Chitinophagales bacterium]
MQLHIISFDVPFPPDYGGAIDVFFKLKSLYEQGIKIIFHCFVYGRPKASELETVCEQVFYYERKKIAQSRPLSYPYIVSSRQNDALLHNLCKTEAPILFEGLHTCFFLTHKQLRNRQKLVRTHNIEHDYYRHLYQNEQHLLKKLFFRLESQRLQYFEKNLQFADNIFAISPADTAYFSEKYGKQKTHYIPAFHAHNNLNIQLGKGKYVLYHGNLSVNENEQAALFLIEKVFSQINISFVLAGKNPTKKLLLLVKNYNHISVKSNLSHAEMQNLIANAHIHALPTFQPTGIKLKLLNALFNGRFCIANSEMIQHTGLEKACILANTATEFQEKIKYYFEQDFTEKKINNRQLILRKSFNNEANAKKIVSCLKR